MADNRDEITKELRETLLEVSEWIKGWDPNFIYDDEWPQTQARIDKVLAASKE